MIKAAEENPDFQAFMKLCDEIRVMKIRTNADTPDDAAKQGPLAQKESVIPNRTYVLREKCRKAFVPPPENDRIQHGTERRKALDELFPFMKADMKGTLEAMDGYPVTIRTLDPPFMSSSRRIPKDAIRSQRAWGSQTKNSTSGQRPCTKRIP